MRPTYSQLEGKDSKISKLQDMIAKWRVTSVKLKKHVTREICKAAARNIENRRKHRKLTRNCSKMKGTYEKATKTDETSKANKNTS